MVETPTPQRVGMGETPMFAGATPMSGGFSGMIGTNWSTSTRNNKLGLTPKTVNLENTPLSLYSRAGQGYKTPGTGQMVFNHLNPEQMQLLKREKELDERNKRISDEELNKLLPSKGFEIVKPPKEYREKASKWSSEIGASPFSSQLHSGYRMPGMAKAGSSVMRTPSSNRSMADMPAMKAEDMKYFGALLEDAELEELTNQEQKDRKVMMLLLKIKNGTPQMRKQALKTITDKAKEFGASTLFNQVLPLLMSPMLEEWERHLMVKVLDRVMFKLDDKVRPYVHKILAVIEPMLIDEDYYARIEGREIISNLAKAAGLATMITAMRPDIDHNDEFVRNTTARAFAVVASSLSVPSVLPFLRAVCGSRKSWQARHTGAKIVQQIALLMGCGVLPHLRSLVRCVKNGLKDEQPRVRVISALAIASLSEASAPFGIEAFDEVLLALWDGLNQHRGRALAAFLKAIGNLIPLMDEANAAQYTKQVMRVVRAEFHNPEEEMKRIVMKVVKQCIEVKGIDFQFVKNDIFEGFWENFWTRKMCLDRKNYYLLLDTTVSFSEKLGGSFILDRVVVQLRDEHEPFRRVSMMAIERIVKACGVGDLDKTQESQIVDAVIYAFHQTLNDEKNVMLNGLSTVINALGLRAKPHLPGICANICLRLRTKSPRVRQQAADLVAKLAIVMNVCSEDKLLNSLSQMLYENLGEEFPEVLGSILKALKSIVNVIGMQKMVPPIKDLLPCLTPILKNRHEKVQENLVDLIGRIANRGADFVNPKEWIRICFDLLELLRAHKKSIRRATVNTFGYIANAIGPQDVLVTLLNNLKVQERQMRVCTTVAIAIVSETCGPFTTLPALMNEYRVPLNNVQNGVLKSLAFMFEYIGEMSKDYVWAVVPLLEDALMDRDLVHRQTAAAAIKHLALGVLGFNVEDCLIHLLNHMWPNIFETSPHVIMAVNDAFEAMRLALGPGYMLLYLLQGLFHPARRVRNIYWRFYNNLYIGAQDALSPFWPTLPSSPSETADYQFTEAAFFVV